jgi:hypothetical protein
MQQIVIAEFQEAFHIPTINSTSEISKKPSRFYATACVHQSDSRSSCFNPFNCSESQFARYFANCSKQDILKHYMLLTSNEFVKFVKTFPFYQDIIITLHKKLHKKDWIDKFLGLLSGSYCGGLQECVKRLHQEVQEQKQKEIIDQQKQWQEEQDKIYKQKLETVTQQCVQNDARKDALEMTGRNPHYRIFQSISVDKVVIDHAKEYGIAQKDITTGILNAYEYQLHKEFVEQLTELTNLADTYHVANTKNLFFDAIGEGIALGIEANKKHEPIIATRFADFGREALEVVKGIGEGVVFGAQEIYEHTQLLMRECATHIAALSNREIAKQITAFCTDWALASKAFTFFHHLCSRSGPLIAEAIEVLKKESAVEYVVAGADGALFHLSETAKTAGDSVKEIVKNLLPAEFFSKNIVKNALEKLSLDKNKIHHILTPKTGSHAWHLVVEDPLNWDQVIRVIEKVIEKGKISPYGIVFQKKLSFKGQMVEVIIAPFSDGSFSIADAWVRTG